MKLELLRYTDQTALIIYSSIIFVHALNHRYLLFRYRARWMLRQDVENSILFDEILVTFNCWTLHYDEGIHFVYNAGSSPAELYKVRHVS
jgi:hypothetical protein